MPYCDSCGFYRDDSNECEFCSPSSSSNIHFYTDVSHLTNNAQQDSPGWVTGHWWPVVAVTPFSLFGAYILSTINPGLGTLLYTATLITYLFAIVIDANYLKRLDDGWNPNPLFWMWLGAMSFFLVGLPTLAVTPVYIYKRFAQTDDG